MSSELMARQRLATDFPFYARHALTILTKDGGHRPLRLNTAQGRLHDRLSEQKRRRGKVRAIVLKARQWGCSTYVEARYYWLTTHHRGLQAFILTHEQASTDALFAMARRFHDHCPAPVKPEAGTASAKALTFSRLDSGYRVGTAGSRAVGHGQTIHLFHGSEVARWPNGPDHMAGIIQAVPDGPGSEIILESTANGIGGVFHNLWRAAERGESDYEAIFVPWFAHDAYRAPPPDDWRAPPAWAEYGRWHGLAPDQLYWAWHKNSALADAAGAAADRPFWQFREQYPATADEAFQASGHDSFIHPDQIMAARKARIEDQSHAPSVLGIDIARGGGDVTRVIDRQGRVAGYGVDAVIDSDDLMDVTGRIGRIIARHRPDHVFIDATGLGVGVFDRLRELGHSRVSAVNFGARASNAGAYANKRAEMWAALKDWLNEGADIPDDDSLAADLQAPGYGFDSQSRLLLEKKAEIKARTGQSPDAGDALALTFAEPVFKTAPQADRAVTAYDIFR